MGNQKSNQKSQTIVKQDQFYHNKHPLFQAAQIIEFNKQSCLKIKIPVYSEAQLAIWQKSMSEIDKSDQDPFFLSIFHTFEKQGLCGSAGILTLYYKNYPYLLTQEIVNRKSLQQIFIETQLWYLLFTIVSAANHFALKKIKLGDIRPNNIFINEDGHVKLLNILSIPNGQTNYYKSYANKQVTYLAPEELIQLSKNASEYKFDKTYSQSFSIGLTMLDAGLLQNLECLYDLKKFTLDQVAFNRVIEQWKNSTNSLFLKQMVLSLCEIDPKKRKPITEIYKQLLPYHEDIINLVPFQPKKFQRYSKKNIVNFAETQPLIQSQFVNNDMTYYNHKFEVTPQTTFYDNNTIQPQQQNTPIVPSLQFNPQNISYQYQLPNQVNKLQLQNKLLNQKQILIQNPIQIVNQQQQSQPQYQINGGTQNQQINKNPVPYQYMYQPPNVIYQHPQINSQWKNLPFKIRLDNTIQVQSQVVIPGEIKQIDREIKMPTPKQY